MQLHHRVRRPRRTRPHPHAAPLGRLERGHLGPPTPPPRLGLTITDKDDRTGRITAFTAWLPGKVYEIDDSEGQWTARTIETHLDRPSVVPLVNDAQSYHPLGNSRITRTLMNLTDFGLRTMVRMEATAEFYAAPRVWFIGASKKFTDDTWSSIVSVMNGMPANKSGDKPTMPAAPARHP